MSFNFYQLFDSESSTYTYLLSDSKTKEAVIIDPVLEKQARDVQLIRELELKLLYILETHIHADHITGAGELRKATGAKIALSKKANIICSDLQLSDGDEIIFGSFKIKVIATPGHTNTCQSYFINDRVFTGDALLIRGTGRTDFQEGSAETLYESITQKLFKLPRETLVYPAHDYKGFTVSTIAEEIKFNPRAGQGKSKTDFVKIMSELNLAYPKKIDIALPANMQCGCS